MAHARMEIANQFARTVSVHRPLPFHLINMATVSGQVARGRYR